MHLALHLMFSERAVTELPLALRLVKSRRLLTSNLPGSS
jgi:hypothetical protein